VTDRDLLAAEIARLLAQEPDGLSCDALALRLKRRRTDVLALLREDPVFARVSGGRRSHWRLVDTARDVSGRMWDGLEAPAEADAWSGVARELRVRLDAIERRLARLERRRSATAETDPSNGHPIDDAAEAARREART
jgi:hypothetical protein